MPILVKNIVRFGGKQEDIDKLLAYIHDDKEDLPITFDKIIPRPKTAEECPKEYLLNENSHIEIDKDYPFLDWLEWQIANWNTKWDAYDQYFANPKMLIFFTANSFPAKVLTKLTEIAKSYNTIITAEAAREDYCEDYGYYFMVGGNAFYEPLDGNHEKHARKVWEEY